MREEAELSAEFMTITRLGEKGQLTVPKEYREALNLEPGAPIAVLRIGNTLMLIPEQKRFAKLCDRIAGVFARHGLQAEDLLATLPEARQRVFERRYPELTKAEPPRRERRNKRA